MPVSEVATGVGMASAGGIFESIGNAFVPNTSPSIGEVLDLYASGYMSIGHTIYLSRFLGLTTNQNDWGRMDYRSDTDTGINLPYSSLNMDIVNLPTTWKTEWFRSKIPIPSIVEANEMLKRGTIDRPLYEYYIGKQCGSNYGMMKAWEDLKYELGGPTDWIRFAVREAFQPQLITMFGYNKEFPTALRPYLTWVGLDKVIGLPRPPGSTNDDGTPTTQPVSLMDLHWWAHWDLPSNTQGYEMLHRLYSDSRFGKAPIATPDTQFDFPDLDLLMRANDIPQYWRHKLQAISFNPLTRVDVRRMYKLGVITEDADLYHAYRAIGYDDINAMRLVNFTKKQAEPEMKGKIAQTKNEICDAWSNGFISNNIATAGLTELGYDESERNAFMAWCHTKRIIKHNKLVLKYIKDNFLTGSSSYDATRTALVQMELRTDAINLYLAEWQYEKNVHTKYLSSKEWLELYENFIITESETRSKLVNLGYIPLDIARMINLRKRKMTIALNKELTKVLVQRVKEQQKILKELEKKKKELTAQTKQRETSLEKEQSEKLKRLMSAYTDKHLIDFWKAKVIRLDEIITVLVYRGWNRGARIAWIKTYLKVDSENEQPPDEEPKKKRGKDANQEE